MRERESGNKSDPGSERAPLSRREFVQRLSLAGVGGGLVTAGLGTLTAHQKVEAAEAMVAAVGKLPRVKLGSRMGNMMVSRVLISSDWSPDLFAPALALGANFVHKAHRWRTLPPEFANLPRDSYYTDITVDSTPNRPDDEDFAYNQVTSTLRNNGLRYYDIFRAHFGWRSVDAFKNQTGTYRAFQRLKREGKVKYFGVSQHETPGDNGYMPYPEMIQAEIESGLIDSMQLWFHSGTRPEVVDVFAKAHKAGIGMTAMKTIAHGGGPMSNNRALQRQLGAEGMLGKACVRFALTASHPDLGRSPIFHACVSALNNLDNFEENMGALGVKVAERDGFIHNA